MNTDTREGGEVGRGNRLTYCSEGVKAYSWQMGQPYLQVWPEPNLFSLAPPPLDPTAALQMQGALAWPLAAQSTLWVTPGSTFC